MSRKYLSPSLDRLFNELDSRWPNRDRRTDGWYTNSRTSYGHNREERGLVHAIDVDDDGIDENYVIDHIYRDKSVLWYVIWNRTIWSNTYDFRPRKYTGSNPHTDHMHIEIYHTSTAENYSGHWGIASGSSGFGPAPGSFDGSGVSTPSSYSPAMNYNSRDYQAWLNMTGNHLNNIGVYTGGASAQLRTLRR